MRCYTISLYCHNNISRFKLCIEKELKVKLETQSESIMWPKDPPPDWSGWRIKLRTSQQRPPCRRGLPECCAHGCGMVRRRGLACGRGGWAARHPTACRWGWAGPRRRGGGTDAGTPARRSRGRPGNGWEERLFRTLQKFAFQFKKYKLFLCSIVRVQGACGNAQG